MAPKKASVRKGASRPSSGGQITMRHVFRALTEIERWTHFVLEVLANFDARTKVPVSRSALEAKAFKLMMSNTTGATVRACNIGWDIGCPDTCPDLTQFPPKVACAEAWIRRLTQSMNCPSPSSPTPRRRKA